MNLVYGVGINDRSLAGPSSYKVADDKWAMFPEYQMWKSLLARAFSKHEKQRRPACKGSLCCDEWKHRYVFQEWYYSHKHFEDLSGVPLQIDKDILYINNEKYSPETCVLVPQYVNLAVRKLNKNGIAWVAKTRKTDRMLNEFKKPWGFAIRIGDDNYKRCGIETALEAHLEASLIKIKQLEAIIMRYRQELCYDYRVEKGIQIRIDILIKSYDKKRISTIF